MANALKVKLRSGWGCDRRVGSILSLNLHRDQTTTPNARLVTPPADRGTAVFDWLPETASWIRRYVRAHSWVVDFHVHRLRHSFTCRYLERGGSVEALQRVLGHSTITLTERYGLLRPGAMAAEARRTADGGTVTDLGSVESR